MTRDSVRERGARPIERGLPLDPRTLVAILVVLGVLLRAAVGGLYMPLSGFRIDVGDFSAWAQRLAAGGPGHFYAPNYFGDYPPGYLYVLWVIGSIGELLRPLLGLLITPGLVKVPGILADAGVAWLLFSYARRFGNGWLGSWSGERIGLVAATIYLFNPGTIFNSSVWGQVDSVGTLALVGTLYLLARGWTEAAAVGAVVALLVKFQFGFLLPVVAIVGIKRHLFGRSSDPLRTGQRDPVRVLSSLAAGLGSLVALEPQRPAPQPAGQVPPGGGHVQGAHHQRLQPVAQPVDRPGQHAALGLRRPATDLHRWGRPRLHDRQHADHLAAGGNPALCGGRPDRVVADRPPR
jgi:hypothetical protein